MRRSLAAVLVALSTALAVLPATAPAVADETVTSGPSSGPPSGPVEPSTAVPGEEGVPIEAARQTLAEAADVLGVGTAGPLEPATSAEEPEATLLLRDLHVALPSLRGSERTQAKRILARPSDGATDQYGDGYAVPSKRRCSGHFCVHYVTTTADKPPLDGWVAKNLALLNKVWRREVEKMGYRAPVKDGDHGGSAKFDVYLKELGSKGLYGYCAPEYVKRSAPKVAAGYCVLDNDFAEAQYGVPPMQSLRVTAAHEFFHAVQFAYDYTEDPWLLETTATWIEERVADNVNDNRQYLPSGQVKIPGSSLDVFDPDGFAQYGNWSFWEHLTGRFGNGIVKRVWARAGAFKGAPDRYSAQALKQSVGAKGGGLTNVFAAYAASNTAPARYYPEGSAWPSAGFTRRFALSSAERRSSAKVKINHLAARNVAVTPTSTLESKRWALRITVNAPNRSSSPAVHVLVRNKSGAWARKVVRLDRSGAGKLVVPFSTKQVRGVTITLANASTRYRCNQGTDFSCRGKPRDQAKAFAVKVAAFKR